MTAIQASSNFAIQPQAKIDTQPAKWLTTKKIANIASIVFAAIGFALYVVGMAMPFMGCAGCMAPYIMSALGSLVLSGISTVISLEKDYDDPADLKEMKEKARRQSYSELVEEHGLEKIRKYQIVSPARLEQMKNEPPVKRDYWGDRWGDLSYYRFRDPYARFSNHPYYF